MYIGINAIGCPGRGGMKCWNRSPDPVIVRKEKKEEENFQRYQILQEYFEQNSIRIKYC